MKRKNNMDDLCIELNFIKSLTDAAIKGIIIPDQPKNKKGKSSKGGQ